MARICIDGFNLAMPEGSGIATYARNLNINLAALGHETQILFSSADRLNCDPVLNRISVVDPANIGASERRRIRPLLRLLPRFGRVAVEVGAEDEVITTELQHRFPAAGRVWASHDIFHAANARYTAYRKFTSIKLGAAPGADVVHWTCPLPLVEPRAANVYTLHDLIPLRLPYATLDNKRAYYALCQAIAARADRVFTVSEASRRDIIRLLKIDEDRVVNTYQAVELPAELTQRPVKDIEIELTEVFGLEPGGYFLFFGAQEPKKNLPRIVEAYLASGVKAPLVIVGAAWRGGSRGDGDAHALATPHSHAMARDDRIRRFEYLSRRSMLTLVAGARATLFPSLYEGFGLPVLESMLMGAPVLTSTAGSLPEVAGDAAVLVDPYDVDAIRDGIRSLDADEDLRRELSARGRLQAAKFSPERYRERLKEAYAPVL